MRLLWILIVVLPFLSACETEVSLNGSELTDEPTKAPMPTKLPTITPIPTPTALPLPDLLQSIIIDTAELNAEVEFNEQQLVAQLTDPQGDVLTVQSIAMANASHGTLSQQNDDYQFVPSNDFTGSVQLDVLISDGNTAATYQAFINYYPPHTLPSLAWVGNSIIDPTLGLEGMWDYLSELFAAEAQTAPAQFDLAHGGWAWQNHLNDQQTILAADADLYLLQGFSSAYRDRESFDAGIDQLIALIENQGHQAVPYMHGSGSQDLSFTDIAAAYNDAAIRNNTDLINVGAAMQALDGVNITAYDDYIHPTHGARYMAALSVYKYLTGINPRAISYVPMGINSSDANQFKALANQYQLDVYHPTLPMASITVSAHNTHYVLNSDVNLQATAFDNTGNDISDSLIWQSDIDGELTTGNEFNLAGLSLGRHVIRISTTGLSNNIQRELIITIVAALNQAPVIEDSEFTLSRSDDSWQQFALSVSDIDDDIDWNSLSIDSSALPAAMHVLHALTHANSPNASQGTLDVLATLAGTYTVTITIADQMGNVSNRATIRLIVND